MKAEHVLRKLYHCVRFQRKQSVLRQREEKKITPDKILLRMAEERSFHREGTNRAKGRCWQGSPNPRNYEVKTICRQEGGQRRGQREGCRMIR